MIISACTCFEKTAELGIRTAGVYATHQIKIRCLKISFEKNDSALYPHRPSARWLEANASSYQKIVNNNTNLRTTRQYNYQYQTTPGPSVRLVENLTEDQLPLLLLLQVPGVVLVHHPVGPLLVEVLVGVHHQNLFCWPSAGR